MTAPEIKQCHAKCPEGNLCVCRSDVPHVLHICSQKSCWCHSAARYDPVPRAGIYYAPKRVEEFIIQGGQR